MVVLPSHTDQLYNAHIQELSENQGPVEVFIEELGEKKTVPYCSLRALPASLKSNCVLSLEGKGKRKKGVMPVASTDLPQQHYHISPNRTTPPSSHTAWTNNNNSRRPLDMGRRMPILQTALPENSEPSEDGRQYCSGPLSTSPQPPATTAQIPLPVTQPPVYLVPVVNVPFASSIGQVNFSWGPSQDPYGKDLPLSDMNTLRYFFNLGNEYSRVVSSFQQSQQPPLPPPPPPPPAMLGPADLHSQPVLTSHYDQGQSGMKNKFQIKKQINQVKPSNYEYILPQNSDKSELKKSSNSESDCCREKESEEEACLSSDSGCLSECSGSLSPSKLESSAEEGDMEGRHSAGESELGTIGTTECVEITSDGKGKGKRKYYMYGNYKLVKPIKEIPPRFQVMLAETSAAKARCEGQPIYIQQPEGLFAIENENSSNLNANANCFVPGQNASTVDLNTGLPSGITFLPCTSFQVPHSQHPTVPSVPPTPSSTVLAPSQQMYSIPPPNTLPPSTSVPTPCPATSQPASVTPACPPLTSLPNSYANGGGSCFYVYPTSPSTGYAPIPGTHSQGQGQVVYMVGPTYPTAPVPTFQPSLPPGSYNMGIPCSATAQ